MINTTAGDGDGARDSNILFKGTQSGGEETTLASISVSHQGTSDDQMGKMIFSFNDGSDGDTPTPIMTLDAGAGNGVIEVTGQIYISGDVSALSFTDRTPYPKDYATAHEAVMSMQRLPDGEYDENDKENQLDHSKLSNFVKGGGTQDGRDLSATVSSQNEVIKYMLGKIEELTAKVEALEAK